MHLKLTDQAAAILNIIKNRFIRTHRPNRKDLWVTCALSNSIFPISIRHGCQGRSRSMSWDILDKMVTVCLTFKRIVKKQNWALWHPTCDGCWARAQAVIHEEEGVQIQAMMKQAKSIQLKMENKSCQRLRWGLRGLIRSKSPALAA